MIDEIPGLIDTLGNKRFCHCPGDLLVIFLAAHGYGPSKGPNKGTEVAIVFTPAAGKDTTFTHAEVAKLLGDMLAKKGLDPKKVIMIFDSCRSGDALDKGRYGKYMKGVQLICAAPDAGHLILGKLFCFLLSRCILKPENKSWADIMACLKKGCDEYRARPEWKPEVDKGYMEPPKAGRPVE